MTCGECERILLDSMNGSSNGAGKPGMSALALAESHAQDCPACAGKFSDLTLLHAALDQVRGSTEQMEAPPRVEANLRAAFHEMMETRSGPRMARNPWATVWASTAALLLLVTGATLYITPGAKTPITVEGKNIEPAERNPRKARQRQTLPALSASRAAAAARKNGRASGKQKRRPGTNDNLLAQAYRMGGETNQKVPAAPGEELSLNGGSNIIRVTVPLSSLAAVGFPVHPDMPDRQVTADVAMNPFGAIIAIRLVE
jgi:hypothetical protein